MQIGVQTSPIQTSHTVGQPYSDTSSYYECSLVDQ